MILLSIDLLNQILGALHFELKYGSIGDGLMDLYAWPGAKPTVLVLVAKASAG